MMVGNDTPVLYVAGTVAAACAMVLVVGMCLGVGRRFAAGALLKPKPGAEELIEMEQVEVS